MIEIPFENRNYLRINSFQIKCVTKKLIIKTKQLLVLIIYLTLFIYFF